MEDVRNDPKVFTIVPVLSGGTPLPEVNKIAVELIPVEFDTNGCLKVPEMPSGLKRRHDNHVANEEYLQEIGKHGRDAQTILDRIHKSCNSAGDRDGADDFIMTAVSSV